MRRMRRFLLLDIVVSCARLFLHLAVFSRATDVGRPWFLPEGCYENKMAGFDLNLPIDFINHEQCRLLCSRYDGAHMAGILNANKCHCFRHSLEYENYRTYMSECTSQCKKSPHQNCGGPEHVILMDVIHKGLPGCYEGYLEMAKTDWLGVVAYDDAKDNTHKKCRKTCSKMGYPIAGVAKQTSCWCGNNYLGVRFIEWAEPNRCDLPCPGNQEENCGNNQYPLIWIMESDPIANVTCLKDQRGIHYHGKVSHSKFAETCLKWSILNSPDISKIYTQGPDASDLAGWLKDFKSMKAEDQNTNYCRNIDNDKMGPWCLVGNTKGYLIKRYCYIPVCPYEVTKTTVREQNFNCKFTQKGVEYFGTKATTIKRETCERWNDDYVVFLLFEETGGEAAFDKMPVHVQLSNFCRNPTSKAKGPWCYIKGKLPNWEYCGIHMCSSKLSTEVPNYTCKVDAMGLEYNGTLATALTGQKCRKWSSPEIQRHITTTRMITQTYNGWPKTIQTSNFCRNPDGEPRGPWCYVEDEDVPSYRFCEIKICDSGQTEYLKSGEGATSLFCYKSETIVFLYCFLAHLTYGQL